MDELIKEATRENDSMAAAAASLSHIMGAQAFKEAAIRLGVYKPKKMSGRRSQIPLDEILIGLHPQYHSSKLRKRMIVEGVREYKCEECQLSEWNGQAIPLTLHHIDGNHGNHMNENLQILCYNCHAQTENFGPLNKKFVTLQ